MNNVEEQGIRLIYKAELSIDRNLVHNDIYDAKLISEFELKLNKDWHFELTVSHKQIVDHIDHGSRNASVQRTIIGTYEILDNKDDILSINLNLINELMEVLECVNYPEMIRKENNALNGVVTFTTNKYNNFLFSDSQIFNFPEVSYGKFLFTA